MLIELIQPERTKRTGCGLCATLPVVAGHCTSSLVLRSEFDGPCLVLLCSTWGLPDRVILIVRLRAPVG